MFDIHTYGRELIGKLADLGASESPVLFSQAVVGHESYDICRYFLAGLQLVCRLSWLSSLHTVILKSFCKVFPIVIELLRCETA